MLTRIEIEEMNKSNILNEDIKGFPLKESYSELKENFTYGVILRGMQYRPDKIAEYYLGDAKMAWAISFANGFTKGVVEYRLGRKIKIPKIESLN